MKKQNSTTKEYGRITKTTKKEKQYDASQRMRMNLWNAWAKASIDNVSEEHKKIAKQIALDINYHFKNPDHGWPLGLEHYVSGFVKQVLGYEVHALILKNIKNKALKLDFKDGTLVIAKEDFDGDEWTTKGLLPASVKERAKARRSKK